MTNALIGLSHCYQLGTVVFIIIELTLQLKDIFAQNCEIYIFLH